MKINSISIENFRCFETWHAHFGQISVFVGENNSGKSSILKTILALQGGTTLAPHDIRAGHNSAAISFECSGIRDIPGVILHNGLDEEIRMELNTNSSRASLEFTLKITSSTIGDRTIGQFENRNPKNPIVPYLSKRKVQSYSQDVRLEYGNTVGDFTYLPAKLAKISNSTFPGHEEYKRRSQEILGFMLTAVSAEGGQRPGIYLADETIMPVEAMGEGVPNIAALLIELITARNKIFVIEEPENDLHPKALKSLLEVLIESSKHNQFFISTHSNIVVQYLAVEDGSLFNVKRNDANKHSSEVVQVDHSVEARMSVLRDLGYALSDFDLWDGWLILEESSAEKIIRDFLIPMFAPTLSRIRTISANGINNVNPVFSDFYRLVVFNHLEEAYRTTTWVKVDGDEPGMQTIAKLKECFSRWDPSRFAHFDQPQFERYFPAIFSERIDSVLSIKNATDKKSAKCELLIDVLKWLAQDKERARVALESSAAEVIEYLRSIEWQLNNN